MDKVHFIGLFLNFIIYLILIVPSILISLKKHIYKNKKIFILYLIYATSFEIVLSIFFHIFSKEFFSIFTNVSGIINYSVYSSKILFITSSLYSIKILIPAFLIKNNKKTAILIFSKIAVNLIFIFVGYNLFNNKGILYSIPICDFVYYIIYIVAFLKVIR